MGPGCIPYGADMTPATAPDIRPPLSRRQAAAFLNIHPETLARWSATPGKGPRYYRSGPSRGRVWYRVEDLERFIESRAVDRS